MQFPLWAADSTDQFLIVTSRSRLQRRICILVKQPQFLSLSIFEIYKGFGKHCCVDLRMTQRKAMLADALLQHLQLRCLQRPAALFNLSCEIASACPNHFSKILKAVLTSQSSWCHFACSCSCYLVTLGPHLNPRVISWKLLLNKAKQITLLWVCCKKVHIALFFGDSVGDFVVCESQCDTYVLREQSSVGQVYLQCMSTNYTSQWWDVHICEHIILQICMQCIFASAVHKSCETSFEGARATSTTAVHVNQYACASAWAGTSKANMTCPVPIHARK